MAHGIFYVLDELTEEQQLQFFCEQIAQLWREHQSVRVWCANQAAAEQLDEWLWRIPTNAFVPHNLVGEGPPQGAPVELCWPQAKVLSHRAPVVVVNLMNEPAPWQGAQLIIEHVPAQEPERQAARDRYKQYRQHGVALQTLKAADLILSKTE